MKKRGKGPTGNRGCVGKRKEGKRKKGCVHFSEKKRRKGRPWQSPFIGKERKKIQRGPRKEEKKNTFSPRKEVKKEKKRMERTNVSLE